MQTEKYIPESMKTMRNWIVWKLCEVINDRDEKKMTKRPINARSKGNAMSNNPMTWCDYETAQAVANVDPSINGVGFMMPLDKSMTFIDLDHCIENGKINEFAKGIMERFKDTYMELSQSGTGIHIFCYGSVKQAVKKPEIELYGDKRFCAMTANCISHKELKNYQAELDKLVAEYAPKSETPSKPMPQSISTASAADILEIIRKSKCADRFLQYFNGQVEANSENTLGLARLLAFFCQGDAGKIKELMYMSGLRRDKFDRKTAGRTWLDYVIEKAIESTPEYYDPATNTNYVEISLGKKAQEIDKSTYEERFVKMSDIAEIDDTKVKYIQSGYPLLDSKIGGFVEGEVSVWSGLNGSGKSNFLMQQILEYGVQGYVTMLFSGEMTDTSIKSALIRMTAGKELLKASKDELFWYLDDKKTERTIMSWLDKKMYLYNNEYTMDADEVINAIRYIVTKGVKVIILDNLMTLNLRVYDRDKYEAQSMFVKELAKLAKQLKIHIHVVMHPRKVQGFLRKDDISGSADLTNACDNVFIIHRVNQDFKNRVTDTYDKRTTDELLKYGNVIEVCKNRRHGIQDYLVGIHYEKETRKYLPSKDAKKQYMLYLRRIERAKE